MGADAGTMGIGGPDRLGMCVGVARTIAVMVLLAGLILGCEGGRDTSNTSDRPSSGSPPAGGGWQTIFDGTSTDALRSYRGGAFPASWTVEDGALRTVPGAPVDLVTHESYGDFELEFGWRVARGGNSGVIYRVVESDEPAWTSGPEYQILDDLEHPDGRDPRTSAAALYALIAPGEGKRLEPVGSWNEGRIVVRDGRVEHWLNGARVVEYEWGSTRIRQLIAESKFRDLPDFMSQDEGHVVLQHHGEVAWFRDVRIRRLGP
jgi:hypothetical protein